MHPPRLTALTRLVGAAVLTACLGAAHAVPALAADKAPGPAHVDEIFMLTKDGQLINRVSITDPLGRIDYKRCQAMESPLASSSRADQTETRGTNSGSTTICDLTMSYNDANTQTEVKAGVNGTWALNTETFATAENMQQLFSVPMDYRSATVMVEGTVDEDSSSSQARLGTDETVSGRVFTVARWDTAPGQLVAAGSLTAGGVALADDPSRAIASPAPRAPREGEAAPRRAEAAATSVDDVAHTATTAVPREVLVPVLPDDAPAVRAWLAGLRGAAVDLRVPVRGDKAALMETVRKNAEEALRLHKTRRAGDLTQRSAALDELAEALDMPEAPLRIECYDISHTQGTHQVGSMVVFEDGAPRKSDYRRFIIRGEDGSGAADDTAAMSEVLTRRFKRLLAEQGQGTAELSAEETAEQIEDAEGVAVASGPIDPETGRAKRFSYAPGLVVVDGGLPQVGAARAVLDELGIDTPIVGLAKRLEEIWVPGDEFPVILPRTSPALYLLQHLRDESHRFAITHHRAKRSAGMTRSVLDDVPGLGPARQAALLKAFGSVKRIRAASVEQISEVKGIGPALAATIHERLGGAKPAKPEE